MGAKVDEFVASCKASGIDPVKFLRKAANLPAEPCNEDQQAACAGKKSEKPLGPLVDPNVKVTQVEEKEEADPDPNRPPKEVKEAFVRKAATLTLSLAQLKDAGLLRADLMKVACDALEVLPDLKNLNSPDAIIAAAKEEDSPEVAEKLRKSASDLYAGVVMKVIEKIASDYFDED